MYELNIYNCIIRYMNWTYVKLLHCKSKGMISMWVRSSAYELVYVFILSYTPYFHIIEWSTGDSKHDRYSHRITMHLVTSDYTRKFIYIWKTLNFKYAKTRLFLDIPVPPIAIAASGHRWLRPAIYELLTSLIEGYHSYLPPTGRAWARAQNTHAAARKRDGRSTSRLASWHRRKISSNIDIKHPKTMARPKKRASRTPHLPGRTAHGWRLPAHTMEPATRLLGCLHITRSQRTKAVHIHSPRTHVR